MRFWMGLILFTMLGLGFSTQAAASSGVCGQLNSISQGTTTAAEINKCHRRTRDAWYDFMALMICRDLNKLSINGAKASDITMCLEEISRKRFAYGSLKKCKKKKHKDAQRVRRCIQRSSV